MSRKGDIWELPHLDTLLEPSNQELDRHVEYKSQYSAMQDVLEWIEDWSDWNQRNYHLGCESTDHMKNEGYRPHLIAVAVHPSGTRNWYPVIQTATE